jgi:inorganic pyrophosphatase
MIDLTRLPVWSDEARGTVHVVVETPKGYVSKLKFEPSLGAMALHRPLPPGHAYPFDWGFVPSTLADDGDPLDAFVLGSVQTAPGVVVACKIVGVLELSQKDGEREQRNDRLVAVPSMSADPGLADDATKLPKKFREETEAFFDAIKREDRALQFLGWYGPARALALLRDSMARSRA